MKRRRFIIASGSGILTGSTLTATQRPAVGIEFEIATIPDKDPGSVDSVQIDFSDFRLTPHYIDHSDDLDVTVTVSLDGIDSTQVQKSVPVKTDIDRSDISSDLPLTIDGINTSKDLIDGSIKIVVDHPDINSKTYQKHFNISSPNEVLWDAEDLDSEVYNTGLVHEDTTNTDHGDSKVIKSGYSVESPYLSDSLIAYWPLHGNGIDFVGSNDLSGIIEGSRGLVGTTSAYFDGNSYANTSGHPSLGDQLTILFWVYPENYNSNNPRMISTRDAGSGNGGIDINIENGTLRFSPDGSSTSVFADSNPSTDQWSQVGVSYDNGNVTIWLNGQANGSGSVSGLVEESYISFGVGNTGWSNPGYWNGNIAECRMYNTSFSQQQVNQLYRAAMGETLLVTHKKQL